MIQEQKVTSLELSKKLKEAGARQESHFWWVITFTTNYHLSYTGGDKNLLPLERNDFCSGFDCTELLERLPVDTKVQKDIGFYTAYSTYRAEDGCKAMFEANTSAEALGKLYLWFLQEGHIKEEG